MPVGDDTLARKARNNGNGDALEQFHQITGRRVGSDGWTSAIHKDDRAAVLDEWMRAQRTGRFSLEYRLRFRDGHFYRVRGVSERVRTAMGTELWRGKIVRIDADHEHICQAERCYCPASKCARG